MPVSISSWLTDDSQPDEFAADHLRPRDLARTKKSPSRPRIWTAEELHGIPDLEHLIEGILSVGSIAAMYGKPAAYKTFVALLISFAIATGLPFAGHAVRQGQVLYIAAEGTGGIRRRFAALEKYCGVKATNLYFVTQAIPLSDYEALAGLIDAIQEMRLAPSLIV